MRVLIEIAHNTRRYAYAPYSGYRVGAAVLAGSGAVYSGCNVENASFGLSLCAERAAIAKAISEGETRFSAVVVVTDDGASPCGACRQTLAEFGLDILVYMARPGGTPTFSAVRDLLPASFSLTRKGRLPSSSGA